MHVNFDEFLESVSKIKSSILPAEVSHLKMAPSFRESLTKQKKEVLEKAKKAGVLALFYPNVNKETMFVLILRKTYKGVHSAQVAFPGGKLESQDASIQDTALRETFEEVGVPINKIKVLRALTEIYIPPSNFYVQPFIAMTSALPNFIKQEDEVETIIEVPLKHFLDERIVIKKTIKTSYSVEVEVPAFKLNGHIVWGATAMILSEIKDLLKALA